jgi:methionyl-tRNA formyltransferase
MKFIIITKKKWDSNNFKKLSKNILVLNNINSLKIKRINPKIIFFIHWSKFISQNIFKKYLCIQFHASNLPKGKGGSPIQNQIMLNVKKTKISAFKISERLDSGPICLQDNLSLKGSAIDILRRMENKSIQMIKKIIKKKFLVFKKQKGKTSLFKRRKPSESKIDFNNMKSINRLYDFLRMLDAPDYPNAFIKLNKFKFTFNDIKINKNKIDAKVKITKNEK